MAKQSIKLQQMHIDGKDPSKTEKRKKSPKKPRKESQTQKQIINQIENSESLKIQMMQNDDEDGGRRSANQEPGDHDSDRQITTNQESQ